MVVAFPEFDLEELQRCQLSDAFQAMLERITSYTAQTDLF